jgi:hypothetical protein
MSVYVDDIIITNFLTAKVNKCIITKLATTSIKDMDSLHYFLVLRVIPTSACLFLFQHENIEELIEKAKIIDDNVVLSPLSTSITLTEDDGSFYHHWLYLIPQQDR